jgi:hemerythrin-like domain-containing protein
MVAPLDAPEFRQVFMSHTPELLNDDGTASLATALMLSHHGFRRDLMRFARALERLARGDTARAVAVAEEWQKFRATLHAHHEAEDHGLFPNLAREHAAVRATIERLAADHRHIDPLLERGDRVFGELSAPAGARAVIDELSVLLGPHLALEEAELIPFLRGAKNFPTPATDAEADLYASGFAWAMHGIAPEVLERLNTLLPDNLRAKLPAACAAFAARCERTWGSARGGSAKTPLPDGE